MWVVPVWVEGYFLEGWGFVEELGMYEWDEGVLEEEEVG
jgi:hypothetical protein